MIIRNIIQSEVFYTIKNVKWALFERNNCYATVAGNIPGLGKSKKKGKQMGPVVEKVVLPVETDARKLVKYVCGSNINKEGHDIELKDDSEYPEWLWKLNIGKPKTLQEMDPETLEYWRKVRKMAKKRNNELARLRKF